MKVYEEQSTVFTIQYLFDSKLIVDMTRPMIPFRNVPPITDGVLTTSSP